MKKLVTVLSLLVAFGASANYEEGKHYQVLGAESFNAPNQVVKVYSVNCPFCYKYEQAVMPNMIKKLPSGASYDAYHITTKPPYGKEKATVLAVAKQFGESQYKKSKMAFYAKYHDKKQKFSSGDEAIEFGMKAAGLSVSDYNAAKNSSEVKDLLAKWDQGLDIAKIQGIPAIVVNGKYLVNTKNVTSLTMLDEMVAELLKK